MRCLLLLAIIFVAIFAGGQENNLIRETRHGLVRGVLARSHADPTVEYYSFRGVPYGKPPVGKLRFQEPLPPEKWSGIKDTNATALKCVQISDNFDGNEVDGKEDCLYLDVFEPKSSKQNHTELLPVLVWIHGGTFIFGSINASGPDYMMEKRVVLVEIEYRVNVFGFLSTKDQYAKGNLGLKDQLLGLKWIKENIKNFGGDPNQVTIAGESAGGASVLYHMLSERSQGFFHKAISQSGSSFNRWALQDNPKEKVLRLAKGLGIKETDSKTIVEKLQKIDAAVLLRAAFNASIVGFYTPYYAQPFAPSIESRSNTSFFTESTVSLLEKGKFAKVPYISGFNTEEGSFGYEYIENGRADINIYVKYPELLVPKSMNVTKESKCEQESLKQIKSFYFKDGNVTNKYNWIPYMSQELFVRGIIKTIDLMYRKVPLYVYRVSYTGSRPISYIGRVGHYEEVQYLFYPNNPGENANETNSDKLTRKRLVTMWTNFATTGNPTPKKDELLQNVIWPRTSSNRTYLDVGTNLTILQNANGKDSAFWEKLFDLCGNPPYVTY